MRSRRYCIGAKGERMKIGQRVRSKETGQVGKIEGETPLSTPKRRLWVVKWEDTEWAEVMAEDEIERVK